MKRIIFSLLICSCITDDISLMAQKIKSKVHFPEPRHEVLMLGTFHFNYPGLDQHKAADRFKVDVLSDERQAQLKKLAIQINKFKPTMILVEAQMPGQQRQLDSLFQEYTKGNLTNNRAELVQLGFRFAKEAGLNGVRSVDAMPFRISFSKTDSAIYHKYDSYYWKDADVWATLFKQYNSEKDSLAFNKSFQDFFLYENSPEHLRISHSQYLVHMRKGSLEEPIAADGFISRWYNRNIRIFSNVLRLMGDEKERVLLIFGAGHIPLLRHLFENSLEFKVRNLSDYIK